MGDDERGPVSRQPLERRVHRLLVDRVEMRGGLVQDQDRRVLEEGSRDRHALALAAGELHAPLAHPRVEPFRQRGHELGEGARSTAASDIASLAPGRARRIFLPERVVEEIGVLGHQRDAAAQFVQPIAPELGAVEPHRPASGSQKRRSRLASVRLARPRRADDGDRGPRGTESETSRSAGCARPG